MLRTFLTLIGLAPHLLSAQVTHESQLFDTKFEVQSGCGLKRFSMLTYDNEFVDTFDTKGRNRYSLMAAVWETSDPSCIKDYGVVQYIRGCLYNVSRDPETGELRKVIRHSRESRGKMVRFKHPVWEVDSVDVDPLYSSFEGAGTESAGRFNLHRYVKKPLVLRPEAESLRRDRSILFHNINYDFITNAPENTVRQLFITDLPSGSSYTPEEVFGEEDVNLSSLELRTCIYKIADVPMKDDPTADPLLCYEWSDTMGFDFEKKNFKRVSDIDPFCLE